LVDGSVVLCMGVDNSEAVIDRVTSGAAKLGTFLVVVD